MVYTADHGLNCSHHGLWGKGNATRPPNMLEEFDPRAAAAQPARSCVRRPDQRAFRRSLRPLRYPDRPGRAGPGTVWRARAQLRVPCWQTRRRCPTGVRPRPVNTARRACGARSVTSSCGRRRADANQLFDLSADPRETRDIRADEPQLAADLGAQLDAFFAHYEHPARSGLLAAPGPASQLQRSLAWERRVAQRRRCGHPRRGRATIAIMARGKARTYRLG